MNPMTTSDGQVDQIIGSAYQVIKYVAANMETLIALAESIDPMVDSIRTSFEALRRTYKEAGYDLIQGTFSTGAAVATATTVLLDSNTCVAYAWEGTLPKFVPQGSSPDNSGGIGPGAWVSKNLESLREQLSSIDGVKMVGGSAKYSQVYEALRRSYKTIGYNLRPSSESFETGGTLTNASDVLLHKASGIAYGWPGPFPKDVGANSSVDGFIDRSQLTATNFDSVSELLSSTTLIAGSVVSTGVTDWRITTQSTQWLTASGLYALPLNGVWFADFKGFDGTGTAGMSALLQSVIDKAKNTAIMLGNNTIRIDAPITYRSGTIIRGAGRKGLYGYAPGVDSGGTLVVVDDGITAFATDVQWCHYPEISGMTFRAKTHGSSTYGQPANFSQYTNGIDVLYTIDGVFKNLGFESIDFGVFNRLGDGQQALRPQISDIVGQDCSRILSFVEGAADVNISNIPIALHCNRMIHCDTTDGVQIDNIRLFQAHERSLSFTNCQFVTGTNITCFETANTQMEVINCDTVNMSALTLSRAGWYKVGTPFPAQKALVINNSRNVKLSGSIERPSGKAVEIVGSDLVEVDLCVKLPYATNGGSSAITVATSKSIKISGSAKIRGNATFTVELDNDSMYETSIDMTSDLGFKNTRFCRSNHEEVKQQVNAGVVVGAGGTSAILLERSFKVPAGKILALTGIRYNQLNGLRPRIGSNFFLTIGNDGEGVAAYDPITLLDNSAGSTVQTYNLQVQLYNNTGASITTPLSEIVAIVKVLQA